MSSIEEKWTANQEKTAFIKKFPGLLLDWSACVNKKIRKVVPLKNGSVALLMEDGTFTVVSKMDPLIHEILEAIQQLRPELESRIPEAYRTLDEKVARDREMALRARLDKILGAIRHNISELTELKEEIIKLLRNLPG